ncbi:MAG: NAD(P)-binding protein, partial [Candidatus Marinimicrobia bacterium]|nr:NAD(P)-binding protein [Candidatus Neomarinimicrobiota bacterium]
MLNDYNIIGSGFSALSAAASLAKEGGNVKVFEKNSALGGRARKFTKDGFVFDMGPSWYWMPDIFEDFFNKFDKNTSDYYNLIKLDPGFQ